MNQKIGFYWLLLPFIVLIAIAGSLLFERSGIDYDITYPPMEFLPPEHVFIDDNDSIAKTLVLYNSIEFGDERDYYDVVLDTLDSMRVKYDLIDVRGEEIVELEKYDAVIITVIDANTIGDLPTVYVNWVENGGRILFSILPDPGKSFFAIYRKLGIISKADEFISARGVEFTSDILPGTLGLKLGTDFLFHDSLPFNLEEDARLHLISGDENQVPLLWDYDYGKGRFVVINTNQFTAKSSRGIIGAAYSLLFDVFVYPVINGSMFFIDDFPSPIPEGQNELITEQFGRDIQNFYVNVWWPDMRSIAQNHNIKFTGMMVETYSDQIIPPFEKQLETSRYQYFGGLLLDGGGELGYHGYNHVPLCLEDENFNQRLGYPGWTSPEDMQMALYELYTFSKSIFPDVTYSTYVPPSNILCPNARQWLPTLMPELKVISSVYLEEEEGLAYEQEFIEATDEVIELPRIIAGYELTNYMWWAAINEVGLHYVNSHFVHPDDILSKERNADKGWIYLRDSYEDYIIWLENSAPGLRNFTAQEGGMAVQRFYRLIINTELSNNRLSIDLENFYDEAWLMIRSRLEPDQVQGGNVTKVASDLYLLEALDESIEIIFLE